MRPSSLRRARGRRADQPRRPHAERCKCRTGLWHAALARILHEGERPGRKPGRRNVRLSRDSAGCGRPVPKLRRITLRVPGSGTPDEEDAPAGSLRSPTDPSGRLRLPAVPGGRPPSPASMSPTSLMLQFSPSGSLIQRGKLSHVTLTEGGLRFARPLPVREAFFIPVPLWPHFVHHGSRTERCQRPVHSCAVWCAAWPLACHEPGTVEFSATG